ncbi:MAG: hypothetical protein HZC17_01995 [Candidatus Omnitrophica bacterium]|nr:hypothetical protein [Candidatus Omnitrophota bacterium]
MKKTYFAAMLAALLVFSGTAFAKTVNGTYAGTQNDGKSIWVNTKDEAGVDQKAEVAIAPETKWEGVAAVAELKDGAVVAVEAEQDETGNWKASSVKVVEVAPAVEAPAAPAQQ